MILILSITLIISTSLFFVTLKSWNKKTESNDIELNAEALRNPTNTGISVAGFLLPLILGLLTISGTKNLFSEDANYLLSSIILLIFSIFIGLFNNYGLATQTKSNETIKVTKKENTSLPAFFVFHLTLLFFSLTLVGISGFIRINNFDSDKSKNNNIAEENFIAIYKPFISLDSSKDELIQKWGNPKRMDSLNKNELLIYLSSKSEFSFEISNDTIVSVNQKLLK